MTQTHWTFTVNSEGYMLYLNGKPMGGAGTESPNKKRHWRYRRADFIMYTNQAKIECDKRNDQLTGGLTMTQHTKTPWTNKAGTSNLIITKSCPDDDDYSPLATVFNEVDAEFIVKACNCHDEFLAFVEYYLDSESTTAECDKMARAALKKAKGEL